MQHHGIPRQTRQHVEGFHVVRRSPGTLPKVIKIPPTQAGHGRPTLAAVGNVGVGRLLFICGRKAKIYISANSAAKMRLQRTECHHPAHRVAAVHHAGRAKNHLRPFRGERIQVDYVLNVSTAKDGRIHAHPVHRVDHSIGGKTPNHGTAPALLAFLNEHLAGQAQQIRRRLRLKLGNVLFADHVHLRRQVVHGLAPARTGYHHLTQVLRLRRIQLSRRTALLCKDWQYSS